MASQEESRGAAASGMQAAAPSWCYLASDCLFPSRTGKNMLSLEQGPGCQPIVKRQSEHERKIKSSESTDSTTEGPRTLQGLLLSRVQEKTNT